MNIHFNSLHKLYIFFGRVGIVHAQVADTPKLLSGTKIDNQRLAVSDMQISIGFWRKAGMDSCTLILAAGSNILFNKAVDEILALDNFSHRKTSSL